jgi:hypothetical protein
MTLFSSFFFQFCFHLTGWILDKKNSKEKLYDNASLISAKLIDDKILYLSIWVMIEFNSAIGCLEFTLGELDPHLVNELQFSLFN